MIQRATSILAISIAGMFLCTNLYAVIAAVEDWPFTNAPMFAHYVDKQEPRFRFSFEATYTDGTTRRIHYSHANLRWMSMRYFFKYVYGSVEQNSPFNIYPGDTPDAFEKRLGSFFSIISQRAERPHNAITSIDLNLIPLSWDDNREGTPTLIGRYSRDTNQFIHHFNHAS